MNERENAAAVGTLEEKLIYLQKDRAKLKDHLADLQRQVVHVQENIATREEQIAGIEAALARLNAVQPEPPPPPPPDPEPATPEPSDPGHPDPRPPITDVNTQLSMHVRFQNGDTAVMEKKVTRHIDGREWHLLATGEGHPILGAHVYPKVQGTPVVRVTSGVMDTRGRLPGRVCVSEVSLMLGDPSANRGAMRISTGVSNQDIPPRSAFFLVPPSNLLLVGNADDWGPTSARIRKLGERCGQKAPPKWSRVGLFMLGSETGHYNPAAEGGDGIEPYPALEGQALLEWWRVVVESTSIHLYRAEDGSPVRTVDMAGPSGKVKSERYTLERDNGTGDECILPNGVLPQVDVGRAWNRGECQYRTQLEAWPGTHGNRGWNDAHLSRHRRPLAQAVYDLGSMIARDDLEMLAWDMRYGLCELDVEPSQYGPGRNIYYQTNENIVLRTELANHTGTGVARALGWPMIIGADAMLLFGSEWVGWARAMLRLIVKLSTPIGCIQAATNEGLGGGAPGRDGAPVFRADGTMRLFEQGIEGPIWIFGAYALLRQLKDHQAIPATEEEDVRALLMKACLRLLRETVWAGDAYSGGTIGPRKWRDSFDPHPSAAWGPGETINIFAVLEVARWLNPRGSWEREARALGVRVSDIYDLRSRMYDLLNDPHRAPWAAGYAGAVLG